MAVSSNKCPSPLSARPIPPQPRTSENTNSTPRRSFNGNPFSRPSVLATNRGFNPVTPANSPADSARRVCNSVKEGLSWGSEEKENESKAAKLKSPAKGSKNFMSPTISASSKIAQSPKKKILVERNDPVRTSITLSDGKATFFSEKSLEGTENVMEPKENLPVEGLPPVTKPQKRVTFSEVSSNCNNASESLSDTVTMDSDICNDGPLVSPALAPLDADPSLPPYDPRTNYLSPRPQFLHYKPNPRIEVLLNKEKGLDVGDAEKLDDIFLSELLSDNLSDMDGSESSLTEDSLKESDGSSAEEMLIEATIDQEEEEEEEPKVSVPALPVAEEIAEPELPVAEGISEAKMRTKPRSSTISKFFSLLLVLIIAFLSISVTDSPILATPGSIDLRFSNSSIPSDIPVLAKANSYFKQYSGEAISYFSKLINDLRRIDYAQPLKFMNLTDLEESSSISHGYLKSCTSSEELDKELEPIELEEDDDESETELDEEEFQMEADLDDADEVEIDEAREFEIGEASTIQLAEVNESDSLEKVLEHGQHELVETEEVSAVVAVGNEDDISERDSDQGLTTSNVQLELAESESYIADKAISTDAALESVNDNPESSVKDDSAGEDAQTLEMLQSPIDRHDGGNGGAYWILGISSLALSLLATTVFYVKRIATVHADQVSSKKFATHHVVKEKHSSQNWPTEVDVAGESCPSEMSSFQISSSYSKKYPNPENDEAQSIEKKHRKSNKRESLTASEFSMGSPSYGSFTTYERIPVKHASGGEEVITPVRRSSRIRSHVISP